MRPLLILLIVMGLAGCASSSSDPTQAGNYDAEKAAKTRISLGLTYLQNGNYTQAKINLDKALEHAPRFADSHYGLAYYYQVVGDNARAHEFYDNALQLAPDNPDIANSYGAYLCQQGQYDKSKQYFEKALANQQYATAALTYENMALCAQSAGRGQDAIDNLINALKYQPNRRKAMFLLIEMYVTTQQWFHADSWLKTFHRTHPASADSLALNIEVAEALGDDEQALKAWNELVSRFPNSEPAQFYAKALEQKLAQQTKPKSIESKPAALPVTQARNEVVPSPELNHNDTSPDLSSAVEQPTFHIVQAKENLYRISLKYNIKLAKLKQWNGINNENAVGVGTKLWLVPPERQTNR